MAVIAERATPPPEREVGDKVTLNDGREAEYLGPNDDGGMSITASPIDLLLIGLGFEPNEGREVLMRIGMIMLGSTLIIIGVAMIMSGSRTAALTKSLVVDTAVDLLPAGKVAKVAKKVL